MAGELDPKTGLLLKAPENSTINAQGVVTRTGETPAAVTPTVTPEPERYSRLPIGTTDEAVKEAGKSLYEVKDPNQAVEEYKTSALANAQERINNITNVYGEKLKTELDLQAPVNENNLQRTNALSALMGLTGGSSALARTTKTDEKNTQINQGIASKVNAEKMAALEKIYGDIDVGAQKIYEATLTQNKENQKTLLDEVAKNATSQVQAIAVQLADTGKSFDDWKNADGGEALAKLMKQTGQTEYQIRNTWTKAIPEALRPTIHTSYIDDGKGGTIMRQVTFNPISKKAESVDYALAVPASTFNGDVKPINGDNGELLVLQPDGSYKDVSPNAVNNKILADAAAAKAKKVISPTPTPTSNEKTAEKEMNSHLSSNAGADGFVSPDDYTFLRNQWITKGYNPTTFDTKFKGFRNPNNPNYITTKAPDTSTKKTTTTDSPFD